VKRGLHRRFFKPAAMAALLAAFAAGRPASAQPEPPDLDPVASLKTIPTPGPDNISDFIRDKRAAEILGKALFFDMQAGGDGIQSCATCHFHAGGDSRSRNQVSPGLLGGDVTFQTGGPNYQLTAADFPLHRLADPTDRDSAVLRDSNDVMSSQGVPLTMFTDIDVADDFDKGVATPDPVFNVGGITTRRVEPRQTPTVINAVFFFRNFWDCRAQNDFNGVNPFGSRDPNAKVVKALSRTNLKERRVSLKDSSLASQAVGPPLSAFEMSWDGRTFPKLGKKLLSLRPLQKQLVHPHDSLLGIYASSSSVPGFGLNTTYAALIRQAFKPCWWDANRIIKVNGDGSLSFRTIPRRQLRTDEFTLMEYNFSLFWGLAIQCYESLLRADDTPLDKFFDGDPNALTAQEQRGFAIFNDKGKCVNCHGGPELTNASVRNVRNQRLERMIMGDNREAVYDNGFYNIGVRPTAEDVGVGGTDPFGLPLSEARLAQMGLFVDPNTPVAPGDRVAVDGAFKAAHLRNLAMTAPFFHNGGQATIRQVVEFYNRGGDFHDENIDNLDPDIQRLNLTEEEIDDLVAFLTTGLLDRRVLYRMAPFDGPGLTLPNGHAGDENATVNGGSGRAVTQFITIPPTGRHGSMVLLPNFLE